MCIHMASYYLRPNLLLSKLSLEFSSELTKYHPLLERDELDCRLWREPQELVERGENGDSRSWKTMGRVDLLIQNWFYKKSKGRQCKGRRPRNFDFFS